MNVNVNKLQTYASLFSAGRFLPFLQLGLINVNHYFNEHNLNYIHLEKIAITKSGNCDSLQPENHTTSHQLVVLVKFVLRTPSQDSAITIYLQISRRSVEIYNHVISIVDASFELMRTRVTILKQEAPLPRRAQRVRRA